MKRTAGWIAAALLAASPTAVLAQDSAPNWVGSWASAQQIPEPHNALPDDALNDATLRQVVRLSSGGKTIRVQLSNAFGTQPLVVDGVHVALSAAPDSARIAPGSDRTVTFDGSDSVTIPAGASYWSDPVAFAAKPLASVTVTMHLPEAPARQTGHPGSRATSYVVPGDHLSAADLPDARTVDHWYQLAGVAVEAPKDGRAIVTLGDSITDGHASTTNGNDRWPDRLAERLQADPDTRDISVLNLGIGGNRILNDGLGPNALARFDRDVLAQPGVRYLIVLEGINDLGTLTRDKPVSAAEHKALVDRIIGAFRQMVLLARSHGIKAIGGTIMPDAASGYYHPGPLSEADRQAINAWIRHPGNFDAVIDFDRITRDPAHPDRLRSDIDSGDGLHPGPHGYKVMADAIPLDLFK
ncbi:SGNH/GDSL hydrolase family protein [Stakelama marina]|uniref:SGNH/GDSL hydrolase family protein n=1 Tax=Stakelama marina TaxID=2826939 RepID=A0A8T4IF91_9SPHN|nr:SGNH/GDSL hydrolase family protein [Stakelama marina]MBR0552524.1 SGNH/GDSL hydrolase family protein [Stakelama marina]